MLKQMINSNQRVAKNSQARAANPKAAVQAAPEKEAPSSSPNQTTLPVSVPKNTLANDVSITGNIKFSHDLFIDGTIKGEIISDGHLTIGKNGRINGEIKTNSVIVYGKVEGNITVTDRAELKAEAELVGDLTAGTVSIEEGASFVGSSSIGPRNSRTTSAPVPNARTDQNNQKKELTAAA